MTSSFVVPLVVLITCTGVVMTEKGLCRPSCELPEVCEPCGERHCCRYPDGVRHWGKWCCYRYCEFGQVCATSACHAGSECKWPWEVQPGEPFEANSSAKQAVAEYLRLLEEAGHRADGGAQHSSGGDGAGAAPAALSAGSGVSSGSETLGSISHFEEHRADHAPADGGAAHTSSQPAQASLPGGGAAHTSRQPTQASLPDGGAAHTSRQPAQASLPDGGAAHTSRQPTQASLPGSGAAHTSRQPAQANLPGGGAAHTSRQPTQASLPGGGRPTGADRLTGGGDGHTAAGGPRLPAAFSSHPAPDSRLTTEISDSPLPTGDATTANVQPAAVYLPPPRRHGGDVTITADDVTNPGKTRFAGNVFLNGGDVTAVADDVTRPGKTRFAGNVFLDGATEVARWQ